MTFARVFSPLLALALVLGWAACTTQPSTTDGGTDGGTSVDAGTKDAGNNTGDAGPGDSGPGDAGQEDAGPPTITLTIAANPNSVLSAIATISWSGPVTGVHVSYSEPDGGLPGVTPTRSTSGQTSPQTYPVLGLHYSTGYTFTAVGDVGSGSPVSSAPATLTTGPLPSGFPDYTVSIPDGGTTPPGYTLLSILPLTTSGPYYAVIVDGAGYPAWYFTTNVANYAELQGDFQQQPDGTYTLALLDTEPAHQVVGIEDTITDYYQVDGLGNQIHIWQALNPPVTTPPTTVLSTDDHDIRLQPNGDALLYGFDELNDQDLTAIGGKGDAGVIGHVLERVTPQGEVTFAWDALQNMKVSDMDTACSGINAQFVDFPHANAIDVADDGNYLVSMRNASEVIKINAADGGTMWTLGGSGAYNPASHGPTGDFKFVNDPLNGFSCQHGPRELQPINGPCVTSCPGGAATCPSHCGNIIMFDDGNGHSPSQSRAVEYALDTTASPMTATLVWTGQPTTLKYSFILGYAQRLGNGNTVIADGTAGVFMNGSTQRSIQEVDPSGNTVVWELFAGNNFGIYRAYRLDSLYGP